MKGKKSKRHYSWQIVLIILLVLISVMGITKFLIPYYKIEDRVEKVKKFKGTNGENALGWLRVQGTNIDFPIVYYDDSDVSDPIYELGWSFSNDNILQKKTTLFSHNVLNVSSKPLIGNKNHKRFEQLMSFVYIDFAKENQYIEYTTGDTNYLFKIYGVSFQKENNLTYDNTNPSKKELKEYIENTKKNSYFDFDVDVDENDKLITLITCTRFFGQTTEYSFVVDARLVRKHEVVNNYKVKENPNYKKIKKIMEGEEENA